MLKSISIRSEYFRKLIESQGYYVDKTLFIKILDLSKF